MGPIPGNLSGRVRALSDGWRLALTPAGACEGPAEAVRLTDWIAAPVPGTVAEALEAAGRWRREAPTPLHDQDTWYRIELPEAGRRRLVFEGLATFAEVWLDGRRALAASSMFRPYSFEAEIAPGATLWICFRALGSRLAAAAKRSPRARWRPFMIENQGLRSVRTTLLGHMPGWTPSVDAVGPWRPILMVDDEGPVRLERAVLRPDWTADGSRLSVALTGQGLDASWAVNCAGASAPLRETPDGFQADLHVPDAAPWFPHTHGDQPLYAVTLRAGDREIALGRTGFRRIEVDRGADGQGFGLRINGEPVFCRGAAWTPPDLVRLRADRAALEPLLRQVREAGMNMLRVTGVGVYEGPEFFRRCDELGILVWQDFMFANFDYPVADQPFLDEVRAEAEGLLASVQGSPSLAVLCGGSEVIQQAAMMGLATGEMAWPLFDEHLPALCARLAPDVPYVRNSPDGGPLPFAANAGVTHYYGVGAYERPLEDARRATVRFAAECLAFANVPQPESLAGLGAPAVHDPRWKARVPRDRGASWDFEDVRDHYYGRLFERDPYRARREDAELYLDLSRMVTGEAMAAVFSEWRRAGSGCAGGLVWLLKDFELGAGWGLIDAGGEPKPCWYALKRVLQPVQVLITDEGVNGLDLHLVNETAAPLAAELRLAAFAEDGPPVLDVSRPVEVAPRGASTSSGFDLIGRFFDLSYAYRFGRRAHETVLAQLIAHDGRVLSEAVHRLAPPRDAGGRIAAEVLGGAGDWRLRLTADRLQPYVHIADPAFRPADDGFALMPGEPKEIVLLRRQEAGRDARPEGEVFALGGRLAGGYGDG